MKAELVEEGEDRLTLTRTLAVNKGYYALMLMLPCGFMILPVWYYITLLNELSWLWFIIIVNVAAQLVSAP